MAPERLTDEQVAEVLRNCRLLPHDFMPVYRAPERCMSCPLPPSQHPVVAHSHSMLADALTQVSADLSAAKALYSKLSVLNECNHAPDHGIAPIEYQRQVESMLEWSDRATKAEAALSALQEKAREALVPVSFLAAQEISNDEGTQIWDDNVRKARAVRAALRSLLPEVRTQEDHDEGHAEHLANEGRAR